MGEVVLNRGKDGRTPCDVVTERVGGRCQFSWACGRGKAVYEKDSWERAQAVAVALLSAAPPPDPTDGAVSFGVCSVTRGWAARNMVLTKRIGHHCFYRSRDDASSEASTRIIYDLREEAAAIHGYVVLAMYDLDSPKGR